MSPKPLSDIGREGKTLARTIMTALNGRAGVCLNGLWVLQNKTLTRLYIGKKSIPVVALTANLTQHERHELENLPFWNGKNEVQISAKCLSLVGAAIKRYTGPDHGTDRCPPNTSIEDQNIELWRCRCRACLEKRADIES